MSLLPAYDPQDPLPAAFNPDDVFGLTGPVGREAANDRADVIRAQLLLDAAGYLDLPPGGPTGWPGSGLVPAIRAYQKDNGLTPDGLLLPEGWNDDPRNGETLRSLKDTHGDALAGQPVPAPAEIDARHEALASKILSDAPPEDLPFRPGQQVAQALRFVVQPAPPPATQLPDGGRTGESDAPPHPPYISDGNARIAAGVSGGLRNARDNLGRITNGINTIRQLAPLYPQIMQELSRSLLADPPPGTPPSQAANDTDRAATPPLLPPEIRDKPQDGSAAPLPPVRTPPFLTPAMQDWIGTLPPRERPFANDLLGIIVESNPHGSRGKPETERANFLAAKACMTTLKEFPRLKGIDHVAGGSKLGDDALPNTLKEEVIYPSDNHSTPRGASKPDLSFKHAGPEHEDYTGRMNTVDILKKGSDSIGTETMTANERRRYNRLLTNITEGVAGWARKMKPGESDAAYTKYVTIRCREMWQQLEDKLKTRGVLQPVGAGRK